MLRIQEFNIASSRAQPLAYIVHGPWKIAVLTPQTKLNSLQRGQKKGRKQIQLTGITKTHEMRMCQHRFMCKELDSMHLSIPHIYVHDGMHYIWLPLDQVENMKYSGRINWSNLFRGHSCRYSIV